MDAFDADVLIYAAAPRHRLGRRVLALFPADSIDATGEMAGIGSVLLLPELLSRPARLEQRAERLALEDLIARLDLRPVDQVTAELATVLGATYRLRAVDAVHLATAVGAGADRFVTNNQRDFPKTIIEVEVTYPDDLPER